MGERYDAYKRRQAQKEREEKAAIGMLSTGLYGFGVFSLCLYFSAELLPFFRAYSFMMSIFLFAIFAFLSYIWIKLKVVSEETAIAFIIFFAIPFSIILYIASLFVH